MSEQDDILENLFRENLVNLEIPVTESLWQRIRRSIEPGKKRRFFIWLFFGGFAALFAVTLLNVSPEKTFSARTERINPKQKPASEKIKPVSQEKTIQEAGHLEPTQKSASEKINSSSEKSTIKKISNADLSKISSPGKAESLSSGKAANPSAKKNLVSVSPYNHKHKEKQGRINNYQGQQTTTANVVLPANKKDNEQMLSIISSKLPETTDLPATRPENTIQNPLSATVGEKEKISPKQNENTKRDSISPPASATDSSAKDSSVKEIIRDTTAKSIGKPDSSAVKKDSVANKKLFFIGVEGGAMVLPGAWYSGETGDLEANNNEKSSGIVLQGGICFKNFRFGTGLGFSRFSNNRVQYQTRYYQDSMSVPRYDSLGHIMYYVDSTFMNSRSTQIKPRIQYQMLQIPVFAEYKIALGKRVNLIPSAGININVLTSASMMWTNVSGDALFSSSRKDFRLISAGSYAGLKLEYRWKQWGIGVSSSYMTFFMPIYDKNSLQVKPGGLYLNGGIRCYFSNQ
jgi:hypothetical protein